MIFKKTVLALSLSAVSAFAAAAPDAPAPAAATAPNLLQGAPAYVATTNNSIWDFTAYTPLLDDDRVHAGGIGQGTWTGFTSSPNLYAIDFGGAPCMDRFGSCPGTPGNGATDVNTVVVYFKQVPGTEQEPSDTTLAEIPLHSVKLYGYKGSKPGVNWDVLEEGEGQKSNPVWDELGEIKGNTLAKRTFTFPTAKYSKFQIMALNKGWSPHAPPLVHVEGFNLPAAPVQP
jgi:hypothetical protein